MTDDSIIRRAFGLAASGTFRTVAELEKALKREGFSQVSDHLCGPSIRMQLKKLMSQPTSPNARNLRLVQQPDSGPKDGGSQAN
jgi:hypothetical protein